MLQKSHFGKKSKLRDLETQLGGNLFKTINTYQTYYKTAKGFLKKYRSGGWSNNTKWRGAYNKTK